jgi:general secretion pathway protein K
MTTSSGRRGSALLAVLWTSAALAAVSFAVASTVRSEVERAATASDGLRAYHLARGAVERAIAELSWGRGNPDASPIRAGATSVDYTFPSGVAHVEIVPESSKLDLNTATVSEIAKLVAGLGADTATASDIARAVDDWRKPVSENASVQDSYYAGQTPSFRAAHASFQEIEELLLVKGITPELYYGSYGRSGPGGGLRLNSGLADCVTVYGTDDGRVDANWAPAALLEAVGVSPYGVQALLARRATPGKPITEQELSAMGDILGAGAGRLRVGGASIVTLRATARLVVSGGKLSDLRRTVAAQVKFMPAAFDVPIHILHWSDAAWSN